MKKTTLSILLTGIAVSGVMAQSATSTQEFFQGVKRQFWDERKEERKEFREERKHDRQEFRNEIKEAREELRQGIKERRDFIASTTASGTIPTPWKDFRKDVKEAKKNFIQDRKEDIKNFKDDRKEDIKKFIGAGFLQNATATAMLAQKLGTSTDALKQMVASGTLHTFIKTKLGTNDIDKFIPKNILGSTTLQWATNTPVTITITQGSTTVSTTTIPQVTGFKAFWQRWFGR